MSHNTFATVLIILSEPKTLYLLFKTNTLVNVMSDSFVLLHGGFIFIHFVADITANLTANIVPMLISNMPL